MIRRAAVIQRRAAFALGALALLATLAVARPAGAVDLRLLGQPLRLDVTESLFLAWHGDDGRHDDPTTKNYFELDNRLNAQLAWRNLLLGVRFDSVEYAHFDETNGFHFGAPPPGFVSPNAWCHDPQHPERTQPGPQSYPCVVQKNDPRIPSNPQLPSRRFETNHPFYLEKLFLSYSGRNLELTLGDFYVNFGRGLVLSIRKVDELGIDTTLRGAKGVIRAGDFSATGFVGLSNIQNVDQASARWTDDPNDVIAGLHADYRLFDRMTLGAHVVGGAPTCASSLANDVLCPASSTSVKHAGPDDYYLRFGAILDAPRLFDWLSLYSEVARAEDRRSGKSDEGTALYTAATVYTGPVTWLLEVKDYKHYQPWHATFDPFTSFVYMSPPTLERVQTQLTNNSDILAARLRTDVRVGSQLLLYASAEAGELRLSETQTDSLIDVYGGAELRWQAGRSHLFPLVGYRRETIEADSSLEEELVALEWDGAQALPHNLSLETQGLVWLRNKPSVAGCAPGQSSCDGSSWTEGNVYVSLKWAPRLALSLGWEFTTLLKEQLNHIGYLPSHTDPDPTQGGRQIAWLDDKRADFFNVSLQWRITPATVLTFFLGGNRPGLKCISGVCRDFPAFNGGRLELVVRL